MMQNHDYEPDITQILALYQQLEDDIISAMTRRMLKMGKVSGSTKYQAELLQSAGLIYDDISELIAQRTDATRQHVKALFEDAGVRTIQIDNQIHKQNGVLPVDIRQDASLLQILEAGYRKTLGMMKNLVSTTALQSQTAFISACDRAYMQVSSGAFSYQEAIRQAVKQTAESGAFVRYPSGHRDRIDVAVRRAVLTGVGQTSASVALQHAKNSGCQFMELTAHSGARPDHAVWQGQLVSLDGQNIGRTIDGLRVFSLDQIGYGTGAGFKGWNCRHNWHPYYIGLSTPNYTPEQIKKLDEKNILYNNKYYSEYEISQMQRVAERKVRALKRRVIASQTALENAPDDATKSELQTDYTQNAVKLKKARKALQEFCKQTGRRNDTFRTQVEGFGRSQAQRAVQANKKAQKDLTSGTKSGIIKTGSDSMYRKAKIGKIEPMPKKQFLRIVKRFKAQGGLIQFDEETDAYLISKNAEAITYNENTILLRQNPGRASVFEELIHTAQYRKGENDGSYPSRLRCEIAAQKKLLRYAKAYKLTEPEIYQTKKALEAYQRELDEYFKNGGV